MKFLMSKHLSLSSLLLLASIWAALAGRLLRQYSYEYPGGYDCDAGWPCNEDTVYEFCANGVVNPDGSSYGGFMGLFLDRFLESDDYSLIVTVNRDIKRCTLPKSLQNSILDKMPLAWYNRGCVQVAYFKPSGGGVDANGVSYISQLNATLIMTDSTLDGKYLLTAAMLEENIYDNYGEIAGSQYFIMGCSVVKAPNRTSG